MQESRKALYDAFVALNRAYVSAEYEGDKDSDLRQIADCRTKVLEVCKRLISDKTPSVVQTIQTEWAGYTSDGMDYNGHMHPHPDGRFVRMGDGQVGVYCAAPLERGECTDPDERYFAVK